MSSDPMQAMKEKRRFLLLASYCAGEDGCTDHRPCNDCLAMCNVFRVVDDDPVFDRELGPAALTKAAPPVEAGLREAFLRDALAKYRETHPPESDILVRGAGQIVPTSVALAAIEAALQQSQSTPGAALLEAARDVVRDYPVAAGTAKGFSHEPGYGSIKRLAAALAVSPVPVDASGALGLREALEAIDAPWYDTDGAIDEIRAIARNALHAAPAPVAGPGHAERICRTAAAWEMEQAARPGIGKKSADCHRSAAMALEMAADDIAKLKTHPASENRHDG